MPKHYLFWKMYFSGIYNFSKEFRFSLPMLLWVWWVRTALPGFSTQAVSARLSCVQEHAPGTHCFLHEELNSTLKGFLILPYQDSLFRQKGLPFHIGKILEYWFSVQQCFPFPQHLHIEQLKMMCICHLQTLITSVKPSKTPCTEGRAVSFNINNHAVGSGTNE